MARYVLCDAIMQVPGGDEGAALAALHDLEQAISLLDHRRYDAESRRASARLLKADGAPAEREIAALVAEHRTCVRRASELREDVLRRIDDALSRAGTG
jgi:predicted  nucleic acid-binding Zn-ribbon protein